MLFRSKRIRDVSDQAIRVITAESRYQIKKLRLSLRANKEKSIICFRCGKVGHLARQCRHVKKTLRGVVGDVKCYQCKQTGHMRRQCPQIRVQSYSGVENSHQVESVVGQLSKLQSEKCQDIGSPSGQIEIEEMCVVSSDYVEV